MRSRRFVFCDIDGTLLSAKEIGRVAFGDAFQSVYGVPVDMSPINFSGATDIRVLNQLLDQAAIQTDLPTRHRFFEELAHLMEERMTEADVHVFPGVRHFLERVGQDWSLGLVSGNIRTCAHIKLKCAGLLHFFGEVGGFGDDDGDRNRMAALALERAGYPTTTFLLGDTPSDIAAARANGMTPVAVCNGAHNRAELEAAGADMVVDSFEAAETLFQALEL